MIEQIGNINEKLICLQKQWFSEIVVPYHKEHPDSDLSNPFCFGVNNDYIRSDRRIMIVGQEAAGYDPLSDTYDLNPGQN